MSDWLIMPLGFVFVFYALAGWPFYRHPILMLALGVVICILAYRVGVVLEFVQLKGRTPKGVDIKEVIAVTSLSLGALGGGIISSAISQKAKQSYVDKIESMDNSAYCLTRDIKDGKAAGTIQGIIYAVEKETELESLNERRKLFKKYL
ncbi:hypothetical protein [Chromobacterium haemolyticum]|uniref:hypothetical protein n=1 Tax=Chromobacterium haemolyticum TaxID=394935 RepID=UPI00307E46DB